MQNSTIITHKAGFNVEVYVNWESNLIEMHKLGGNHYYKGSLDTYTNFAGNMQDFVNTHKF